jgi:hypothetical protein
VEPYGFVEFKETAARVDADEADADTGVTID